jgi:hypothetical protein
VGQPAGGHIAGVVLQPWVDTSQYWPAAQAVEALQPDMQVPLGESQYWLAAQPAATQLVGFGRAPQTWVARSHAPLFGQGVLASQPVLQRLVLAQYSPDGQPVVWQSAGGTTQLPLLQVCPCAHWLLSLQPGTHIFVEALQ